MTASTDNPHPDVIRIAYIDQHTGHMVADGSPIGERETLEVYQLKLSYGRLKDAFRGVYKP